MERKLVMFSALSVLGSREVHFPASGIMESMRDALEHAEATGEDTHIAVFTADGSEVEMTVTIKPGKRYKSENQA